MKKPLAILRIILYLCLFVVNNSLYSQNFLSKLFSSEKSIQELNKLVSPAVVQISNIDYNREIQSNASGFIVRENGVIVTNFHVIDKAHHLAVKTKNDFYEVTGIIDINRDLDFAIIKINAKNLPVVSLGNSQEVEVGSKIVAIGSPQGLTNTISDGIISGKRQFGNNSMFQITAPIDYGSSGGVLLNMYGEGIGITTGGMSGTGNLNFAIPIHHLRKLSRNDQSIRYSMERFASIYGVKPPPKPSTNRAYQAQDTYTNQSSNNNGGNFLGWCFWLWIIWGLIPP